MKDLNIHRSQLLSLVSSSSSPVLVLLSSCVLLGLQLLSVDLLCLFLENRLDQHSLVLELVTLGSQVKFVVQSSVDLL